MNQERIPIKFLKLSKRSSNVLSYMDISFVDELEQKTAEELLKYKNFGKVGIQEIREKLGEIGKSLKDDNIPSIFLDKNISINIAPHLDVLKNELKSVYKKLDNIERIIFLLESKTTLK